MLVSTTWRILQGDGLRCGLILDVYMVGGGECVVFLESSGVMAPSRKVGDSLRR